MKALGWPWRVADGWKTTVVLMRTTVVPPQRDELERFTS
jgi:hypothetical protein